jgi:hypothetical protein
MSNDAHVLIYALELLTIAMRLLAWVSENHYLGGRVRFNFKEAP